MPYHQYQGSVTICEYGHPYLSEDVVHVYIMIKD